MQKDNVLRSLQLANDFLKEEGTAWIRDSALHLRAFYWGVCVGLKQCGASDADLQPILMAVVGETMFPRTADDQFPNTELGKRFVSLRDEARRLLDQNLLKENPGAVEGRDSLGSYRDRVHHRIDELDSIWLHHSKSARGVLGAFMTENDRSTQSGRWLDSLDVLERSLRRLALVEGSH